MIFILLLAMRLITDHKAEMMMFTDEKAFDNPDGCGNVIEVRENNITEDFDYAIQTPYFDKNVRKPIVIRTFYNPQENGVGRRPREVKDYGGPKIAAVTMMLDQFVYPRLKELSSSGKVISPVFGMSPDDWKRDLITSGKIAGILSMTRVLYNRLMIYF